MVNTGFKKNDLQRFIVKCANKKLVIIGDKVETEAVQMIFLDTLGIIPYGEFCFDGKAKVYQQITLEELTAEKNQIVVLITDRHPFKVERWLILYGIQDYYCSQLFLERYIFNNNTNVCYFFIDD
jgi:hypothetical protein